MATAAGLKLVGDQHPGHGDVSSSQECAAPRPRAHADLLANAQSSQGSSASRSAVSTVAPPQSRSPAGASR